LPNAARFGECLKAEKLKSLVGFAECSTFKKLKQNSVPAKHSTHATLKLKKKILFLVSLRNN